MREFKLKKWVAAGLMASMPYAGMVDAAGLGRLNVLSQLGQPFAAEIELVNVAKEELASLKANLASPAAYQAANLQFNPSLNALRLSVERRPNGTPYIRATSFRPVSEPFLDLLIELVWQGGKVAREYSALLDPPGMESPAPAVTAPVVAAPAAPVVSEAPTAKPPVAVQTPAPATPAPVAKPAPAPASALAAGAKQVTVKQGDTLGGIANSVKPEGVSLEQTLVGLFRANPDAFIGNNINQLRAGKILNVPEREQLAAVNQGEAAQEVRVHSTNWNSYRQKVADTAPATADAAQSAKGKITARVDDKGTAAGPKDVVVLSKGDAGGAAGGKGADRVRALQEDLAARDKALVESKERIAQLEKTLKDMQKLAEIKNPVAAAAQKGAETKADMKVPPPEVKAPPKAEPTKVEPPKAEPPKAEPPKVEPPKADTPPSPPKADAAPAPKKAASPPPPPPPAPEPGIMDTVMDNILPIGGGAAALLAAGGGFWAYRRRKKNGEDDDDAATPSFKTEPHRSESPDAGMATLPAAAAAAVAAEATVANVSDVVDPIDEAQVYIDHGRDAQAEDILKEAMGKQPAREDIPLKLLEVYAARGDKDAFNGAATEFHTLTGGAGGNWGRAAAMGYALDPGNALYPTTTEVVDLTAPDSSAANVDLDIGGGADANTDAMGTTTDILLDEGGADADADLNKTMMMTRDSSAVVEEVSLATPPSTSMDMDFKIDLPAASVPDVATIATVPETPSANNNLMDFNLDLPAASEPEAKPAPSPAATAADSGLDFKVDLSGIDLNLDDKPTIAAPAIAPAAAGGAKDAHWEDVQQKFDLARAYQEMGDKEGAIEILHEVEREGDVGQKAEAQKMLQSLK